MHRRTTHCLLNSLTFADSERTSYAVKCSIKLYYLLVKSAAILYLG